LGKVESLDTLWEAPDELWAQVESVLREMDPPKPTGRKRGNHRQALNGVIFRMRTGCQWNRLPKEFGDDSTVHRTFQRWVDRGVFPRIWAMLVQECAALGGVDWEWQAVDGAMGKARFGGGAGPNPTDRGKNGSKRSILVEAGGGPLSVVVAGANVHDTKLLGETLRALVVQRPQPAPGHPQHLCLDRGYDNPTGRRAAADYGAQIQPGPQERSPRHPREQHPTPREGGLSSAPWRGSPSAAPSLFAMTRNPPTSWVCSNLPAPSCGSDANGDF